MFDAKPEDREKFAVFVLDIETDHKSDGEGGLVPFDRIILGKKGAPNYQQPWDVGRLMKDDPTLWEYVKPIYEKWKATNTITTEGHPLEAWPSLTKGQLKQAKNLGLRSVEDFASATDTIREKYGMGFIELQKAARAFLANKDSSAATARVTTLEDQIKAMASQLDEAQRTIEGLMAAQGKTALKPRKAA
jgi:hypothetical protein